MRRPASISAIVFGAVLLSALSLRCRGISQALFFGDEWHTFKLVGLPFGEILTTFDRYGTGVAYPFLARLCVALLGSTHLALRLPALVGGLLALWMTLIAARRTLGREAAWMAVAFLALNSMSIFYSGFARSYSLVCALGLVLLWATDSYLALRPQPRWCLPVIVLAGAGLPFLHLTAASTAVGVGLGAISAAGLRRDYRSALSLTGAFLLGFLLTLLLHVPAWSGLQEFIGRKTHQGYYGSFGAVDCAALFVGHRSLVYPLGVALFCSLVHYVARRRSAALPLLGALLLPPLAVILVRPFGDAYAYARYALAALPAAAMLLGYGARIALVGMLGRADERAPARALCALGMAVAVFAAGSYGLRRTQDGVFSKSYTGLFPLPAFDGTPPELNEVYRTIAADESARAVLEIPQMISRGVFYYRNAALVHRKRVQTGFMTRPQEKLPEGYVSLAQESWLERVEADYVILHLDILAEVEKYWGFVYSTEPFDAATRAYMERHRRYGKGEETGRPEVARYIEKTLGRPIYRSPTVIAWKVPLD